MYARRIAKQQIGMNQLNSIYCNTSIQNHSLVKPNLGSSNNLLCIYTPGK